MIHITPRTRRHTSAAPRPRHAAPRAGRPSRAVHTPRCTLCAPSPEPHRASHRASRRARASPRPRRVRSRFAPAPCHIHGVPHPTAQRARAQRARAQWPRLASAPSSLAAAPYARLLGRPQRLRRCRTGWGTQRRVGVLGGAMEASAFA